MKKVTIKNYFHGTQVVVLAGENDDEQETWFQIQAAANEEREASGPAHRKLRRVERTLCGFEGCTCGTVG